MARMKKFLLAGSIVDTSDRATFEDVTPVQFNAFLKSLEDGEAFEVDITSFGGSCSAGLAICNLIKQASAQGHESKAHVIGIAASMASAVACACGKLVMDSNAFIMVHCPWTVIEGNAAELRKEADTLDKFRDALLAVYRTKFETGDETIKAMLDAETWIVGEQAGAFGLKCEIIPTGTPLKVAAKLRNLPKFAHTPKAILDEVTMENETTETAETTTEETTVETTTVTTTTVETTTTEETTETTESAETETAETETTESETAGEKARLEMIPRAECEKRVAGMQSTMAKKIDALRKEYDARIKDFESQLQAKSEELTKVQADVTSYAERLQKADEELRETVSALTEKENALATLTAGALTPSGVTDWRTLKGQAFFDYVKAHPEINHRN